jgi:hypothetical protein
VRVCVCVCVYLSARVRVCVFVYLRARACVCMFVRVFALVHEFINELNKVIYPRDSPIIFLTDLDNHRMCSNPDIILGLSLYMYIHKFII